MEQRLIFKDFFLDMIELWLIYCKLVDLEAHKVHVSLAREVLTHELYALNKWFNVIALSRLDVYALKCFSVKYQGPEPSDNKDLFHRYLESVD